MVTRGDSLFREREGVKAGRPSRPAAFSGERVSGAESCRDAVGLRSGSPSASISSICSFRSVSETRCSVTTSLSIRTRSLGTACLSTTTSSSWSTTSCSSSVISPPDGRVVAVGVGDRLALDAHLLALDRDGLGDVLGDDVLAQARTPGLALGGADAQLLLGARHRVVGRRTADVVADVVPSGRRSLRHPRAAHCRSATRVARCRSASTAPTRRPGRARRRRRASGRP